VAGSVATFFVYVGAEVTAGQWSFTLFTLGRGVSDAAAGSWVAGYFAAMTAGRFLIGWLSDRASPMKLLRITGTTAAAGAILMWIGRPSWLGAVGLFILGLSLAPMFPLLIGLTPGRAGSAAVSHLVGFQIAAASVGAIVLSGGAGFVVDRTGIESIGAIVLGCVIAFVVVNEFVERATRS
jgi:fucose permease